MQYIVKRVCIEVFHCTSSFCILVISPLFRAFFLLIPSLFSYVISRLFFSCHSERFLLCHFAPILFLSFRALPSLSFRPEHFFLCHFERSEAKWRNPNLRKGKRCFDYVLRDSAQHDNAEVFFFLLFRACFFFCHFDRSEAKWRNPN